MSLKIVRERPSQRRHHRISAPLLVTLHGHTVKAADWSLGGVRLEDFPGRLPAQDEIVDLTLALPFQGFEVSFAAKGRIVRAIEEDGRRTVALAFTELGEREREIMSHFIEELVRGSMVPIEDTIQRIDVPVTPVSTDPDQPTEGDAKIARRRFRTALMSTFYLCLGIIVFGYAGLLAYANFMRMEIDTAVITAPVESVKAQIAGRIVYTDARPGDEVRAGQILLRVEDNELEKAIDLARIKIEERRAKLDYLRQRLAEEKARMQSFATIEHKNVEQARLAVEAAEARVKAAREQYKRLSILFAQGYTTRSRLDEAEKRIVTARKKLAQRRVELAARRKLLAQNVGRRHYTGQNFVGDIGRIEAELRLVEREVRLAERAYQVQLKHRERLAVRAPFDGILLELPRVNRAHVSHGDVVAVMEQKGARHITAYLKQEEVLRVGLGEEALVFVPALEETLKARITKIDRTSGFVAEQESKYTWRGSRDRSAKVILSFVSERKIQNSETYRPGLPVIVIFGRRSTNQILTAFERRIRMLFG